MPNVNKDSWDAIHWGRIALQVWIIVFTAAVIYLISSTRNESRARTKDNSETIAQIQKSRLDSCRDQNKRHDKTLEFLQGVANSEVKAKKLTRKQADASLKLYYILIGDLAPMQNCIQLIKLHPITTGE